MYFHIPFSYIYNTSLLFFKPFVRSTHGPGCDIWIPFVQVAFRSSHILSYDTPSFPQTFNWLQYNYKSCSNQTVIKLQLKQKLILWLVRTFSDASCPINAANWAILLFGHFNLAHVAAFESHFLKSTDVTNSYRVRGNLKI